MKTCTKCGESLPRSEFYAHPLKGDGLMGTCKECHRRTVAANRTAKRSQYAAYERERFRRPQRRERLAEYQLRMREAHPERRAARIAVGNALRDGRLTREPCRACGTTIRVQAHHADYSRPLDVEWLCFKHHREIGHGQTVEAA